MEYILNEIKQHDLIQIDLKILNKLLPGKYIKHTNNFYESNITLIIVDTDDVDNYQILKPNTIIYKINENFNYFDMISIYYNFCLTHSANPIKFHNKRICLKKNYIGLKNIAYSICIIRIEHDNNLNPNTNRFCLNENFDKFALVEKYLDNKINNLITIYYNLA